MAATSSAFRIVILSVITLLWAAPASAASYLLFFESQGVVGYSREQRDFFFYSMNQEELMQKPSIGFDYLQRLSGESGDIASFALQVRLAWNSTGKDELEPQVYNAFLKYKAGWSDLWIGHNRPALGLSSSLDSHGLLLPTLAMQGFGFDRDWGVGTYRDFPWGNLAFTLTTGSGAPVYFKGNYLASGRVSYGVLARDNYNVGVSVSEGETLETMGYTLMDSNPKDLRLAGGDLTFFMNNLEHRIDLMTGRVWEEDAYALFYRFGVILDEETRWKMEFQPSYLKVGDDKGYRMAFGVSHQMTSSLAIRTMYVYDNLFEDHRVFLQLYLYRQI